MPHIKPWYCINNSYSTTIALNWLCKEVGIREFEINLDLARKFNLCDDESFYSTKCLTVHKIRAIIELEFSIAADSKFSIYKTVTVD